MSINTPYHTKLYSIAQIIYFIVFIFFSTVMQVLFIEQHLSFAQQNTPTTNTSVSDSKNISGEKQKEITEAVRKTNNTSNTENKSITTQQPTPQSQVNAEKQELSPEYNGVYNVQKHDTLWDISGKALKSPERWPALWGRNPHIRNPHWIYPGDTLYLDQQKNSSEGNESTTLPQVPAMPTEPLEKIEVNPPYYYFYPLMESVGYIKDKAITPVGKIISCMPKYQKEIDQDNGVYLQIDDESNLMVGDQFQIIRTFYVRDKIPKSIPASSLPWVQHYITGIVEVTKLKAKPCECHEQISQVEGQIITAYRTINADDILIPYTPADSKILVRKSNEQMNAKILFSEDHKKKIAENAIVFIDKGKNDGLKTGQFYDIFNQPRGELTESDKFFEKTEHIGSLVVLRIEDKTSSALITYSYKDITPGDIMVSPRSDNSFSNITLMGNYK